MAAPAPVRTVDVMARPAFLSVPPPPAAASPSSRVRAIVTALVTGLAAGTLLGVLTQVGQGALPDGMSPLLANSAGAWAAAAFAVGAALSDPGRAALAGAATLVSASVAYYAAVAGLEGIDTGSRGAVIWGVAGLVAGPAFAVAGHAARQDRRWRPVALAVVGGVLIAEAMHSLWWAGVDGMRAVGAVEMTIGIATSVVALATATRRQWPAVVAAAAIGWVATRAATEMIDLVFQRW